MKLISGIVRGLAYLSYAVIILSLLVAAPILLGYRPVVVLSGSMAPAYPVGSIIYYKQTGFESLGEGDAITFGIGERSLATHRIVSVDREAKTFVTKGDANPAQDAEPVPYERVRGRATRFALPYAGYATGYLRQWYAVGGIALILLLDMLLRPSKETDQASAAASAGSEPLNSKASKSRPSKQNISAADFFKDM